MNNRYGNVDILEEKDTFHDDAYMTRLSLYYTPAQQEQYHRPFVASGDVDAFYNCTAGGSRLQASQIANSAGQFIRPAFQHGARVDIANGFSNIRYAFFLEIVAPLHGSLDGDEMVEVISGYTSSDYEDGGVKRSFMNNDNVLISPDLVFYVNNRIRFTRHTARGSIARVKYDLEAPCMLVHDQGNRNTNIRTLRPEDVLYHQETRLATGSPRVIKRIDMRANIVGTTVANARYNSPSHYVSDLLRAHLRAADPEVNQDTPYGNYHNRVTDTISQLAAMDGACKSGAESLYYRTVCKSAMHKSAQFTFSMLCDTWTFNYVDDRTVVYDPKSSLSLIDPMDTKPWHGSNEEVMIAYQLTHIMPYILMQQLLSELTITITNRTMDNRVNITVFDPKEISQGFFTIAREEWLCGAIQMEVVEGVLRNCNVDDYTIQMTFRLCTNSDIRISLDGRPFSDYCAPMFCSSIYSPQVATNEADINNVSDSIVSMTELISCSSHPYSSNYGSLPDFTAGENRLNGRFINTPETWDTYNRTSESTGFGTEDNSLWSRIVDTHK
jgi:hypothetical protein